MDAKVDDGGNDGKVNEIGEEVTPKEVDRTQGEHSVAKIAGGTQEWWEDRIDDIGDQRSYHLGDGPTQEETDGEPDCPLLANEIEKPLDHGYILAWPALGGEAGWHN